MLLMKIALLSKDFGKPGRHIRRHMCIPGQNQGFQRQSNGKRLNPYRILRIRVRGARACQPFSSLRGWLRFAADGRLDPLSGGTGGVGPLGQSGRRGWCAGTGPIFIHACVQEHGLIRFCCTSSAPLFPSPSPLTFLPLLLLLLSSSHTPHTTHHTSHITHHTSHHNTPHHNTPHHTTPHPHLPLVHPPPRRGACLCCALPRAPTPSISSSVSPSIVLFPSVLFAWVGV